MLDIAKLIDMPLEFVALRHEATHEELPGIQRLMSATQQALDWLWRVYWSRLEEPEDLEATKAALPGLKSEAATLLRGFRKSRRDALRSHIQNSPDQLHAVTETSTSCATLCGDSELRQQALAEVLVQERLLLPSNRE
jgi:ribosomal biogenesis protein LAS1